MAKQLAQNYSISGAVVTLTGVNISAKQLLFVADNTAGTILYVPGTSGVTVASGTNTTLTFGTSLASNSDVLTIYYDDGLSPALETGNLASIATNTNAGTAITGQTLATGSGLIGWLSNIYAKLAGSIAVTGTFWQTTQPVSLASLPALAAGANTIGSISNTAFTANAGTNLNTSLLALESGGNLATIATNTGKIPSKGAATTANSTPVNIASDQTVPVSGTVTANTGLSQPLTDAQLRATAVPVSGTFYQATQPVSGSVTATISGTPTVTVGNTSIPVTGTFWQTTQPVSLASVPLAAGAAQDGTDGTSITAPTGGSGIRGWLSGIYSKLSGSIAVTGTFWQATQPVSGTVAVSNQPTSISVSNFPATQPVSGTVAVSGTIPVSAASALPISGSVNPPAGSLTMFSGTVGTSSVTLLFAATATKALAIQNTSVNNILYVSTASPATATNSIVLAAGQGYEFSYVPSNALYALGSAASTTYTAWLA